MYVLTIDELQVGDIILTRKSDRESHIIRTKSKSNYSHAILYAGDYYCLESDRICVRSSNPLNFLFEHPDDMIVLRLVQDIDERDNIIFRTISHAGTLVGVEHSLREMRRKEKEITHLQFCTRFVTQSYSNGGIDIVDDINFPSCSDIENSKYLQPIENCSTEATGEEIDFIMNNHSYLDAHRDSQFNVLQKARELSNEKIYTFSQLSQYLLYSEDSRFDKLISDFISNSDYLKFPDFEEQKNPEYYNYQLFKDKYHNIEKQYAISQTILSSYYDLHQRYTHQFKSYLYLYSQFKCEYCRFRLHIELYKSLLSQNEIRKKISSDIITELESTGQVLPF